MRRPKRIVGPRQSRVDDALRRYELVAANSRDIILFMRRVDGRLLEVNAAATKAYGYTREELLALTVHDLRATGTRESTADQMGLADGHGLLFETVHRRKDGSTFPVEVSTQGSTIDGTRTLISVVRDITDRKRAEEALRRSEERYRRMFESHVAGFALHEIICDERGVPCDYRFLEVNPAFEQLTGLVAADVIGRTVLEVLPGVEPVWIERYGRVALSGLPDHFSSRSAALDRDFEVTAYQAGPGRFAVMFVDVTGRARAERALQESEERFRSLVDSIPQLAWMAQPDGYITWYNRRWYEYTGTTPQQMEGWGWQSVHDPAALPDVLRHWKASIATGTVFEMEFPLRGADGQFRRFLTRVSPLKHADGTVARWFGTNTDVTELVEARESLRDSDRRKSEFLAVLSHELRNPLAPIRNSMYLLERAAPGSEQAARAMEVIRRQTEHLTRLVDDLLDVTRISRGKIDLRCSRVDLRDVVRKATDDLRSSFELGEVVLRVEHCVGPVWVDADATRVAQIVGNMLHNALKFTPAHGTVTVGVATTDGRAEISVRDDGIGMEPEQVERMFEPFAQADHGLARTQGGLGLGLALVKGLVELHGGSVRARSEGLGRGAEFVVALPLSTPAGEAGAPSPPAETEGRLVLIIEDNADAGQSLAEILRLHGHRAHVARDGRSGMELARALRPDVIMCDIGLPDLAGYDVARALRRDDALRSTRLVALSGYAQPEDRERSREAGFDAHLAKPAALDELMKAIAGGD